MRRCQTFLKNDICSSVALQYIAALCRYEGAENDTAPALYSVGFEPK